MSILRSYRLLALFSLITFLGLTVMVIKDRWRTIDFNLTVKIQDRVSTRLDDNLVAIVDLGSMEIQTLLIFTILALTPISKKIKLLLLATYLLGLGIVFLGKTFIPQPAPPFFLQRGSTGFSFPSSHVQVDASYPSGHTYRVMFALALLWGTYGLSSKRQILHLLVALATIGFAGLLMLGLVVLGKHWVSDIFGGALVALCLVFGSLLWNKNS